MNRQAVAQARHSEQIEAARNDGWIDGMMDNNDGSWTPSRYKFPSLKVAYHAGLKTGTEQRLSEAS
jgi:hypothetical protein